MRKPILSKEILKNRLPLFAVGAFLYIAIGAYGPYLGAYYSEELKLSPIQIGQLFTLGPLVAMIAQPIWAHIADKTGNRRRVLLVVACCCAVAVLQYYIAHSFVHLMFTAAILTMFSTSLSPLADSIMIMRASDLNFPFAHIRASGSIGYAIMVTVFGFIYRSHPYSMFALTSAMYICLAFFIYRLPKDEPYAQAENQKAPTTDVPFKFHAEYVFLGLFAFICYTAFNFTQSFLGVYALSLGFDQSTLGLMNTFAAVTELPALLGINVLIKKFGSMRLIFISSLMLAVRVFCIASGTLPLFYLAQLFQGTGFIMMYCCCVTYIGKHVPRAHQSKAQTCYALINSCFANLSGYMLGGVMVETYGLKQSYIGYGTMALLGTFALGLAYLIYQRRNRLEIQP